MKRDAKKMAELEIADLDAVSGGIGPAGVIGLMAVGWGAKYVYDNYLRSPPKSASRGAVRRDCWGQNRGGSWFEVEVCR